MKVTSIIEISSLSENFAKKIGFKITDWALFETKEKWICLQINWTAHDDWLGKVKYVRDGGSGSRGNCNKFQIFEFHVNHRYSFHGVKRTKSFELEAGISWERNPDKYDLSHFINTKYGVLLYFSPRKFGASLKTLDSWRDEEYFKKYN